MEAPDPWMMKVTAAPRKYVQLAALGVGADAVGRQEDWHSGSRRQKK